MPSIETHFQAFQALIRTRTLCLVLLAFLLFFTEPVSGDSAIRAGWELLFIGAASALLFIVLGRIKRLTRFLLPVLLIFDSLLVNAWITVSGGPVSHYLPLYLLILISAVMVLSSRSAAVVLVLSSALFFLFFYWDYLWHWPLLFGADQINPYSAFLEKLPPAERREIYSQQTTRWFFFFLLLITLCVLLMRRVWVREEKIRAKEKVLEQKRRLIQLGELTGRIAHGVNTPLGLISGNLELLMAETPKKSKTHQSLSQIQQYVERAIQTVRSILDYSRQSLSEIKPVQLGNVIRTVAETVAPKLQKAHCELLLDIAKDLPPLMAYPEGLFQVFLNLVENAVDSVEPGGVVTVSAQFKYHPVRLSAQDQRGNLQVTVRDTGKGIPPAILKRIFEPFYSTKSFGRGTGLGLAIVKRIVEEHGGQVQVQSRVGEGTIFTLTFPKEGIQVQTLKGPGDFSYNEKEEETRP